MLDNEFSILDPEETRAAIAEASEPDAVEQVDRTAVLDAVERADAKLVKSGEVEPPKRTVPRRRVTKVEQKHIAQDALAHGIATVLGYWREDAVLTQRLTEAGIDREQFAGIMKQQADRAVRALGFTEAWSA